MISKKNIPSNTHALLISKSEILIVDTQMVLEKTVPIPTLVDTFLAVAVHVTQKH